MTNPLRNEIIGHIEASGELACWIVPYLYHAAYQTVRELERDGTIVVEVGKRGEPVYVFAPPAAAPAATAASETTDDDDTDQAGDSGFGHCIYCGKSTLWTFDGNTWLCVVCKGNQLPSRTPASAAPVASAAAAQAALRGHTFEKPKAVKLTKVQREALDILSKIDQAYIGERNQIHKSLALGSEDYVGSINASTAKSLISKGLAVRRGAVYAIITDKGRAALEGRAK